jgi:hypothetical protein
MNQVKYKSTGELQKIQENSQKLTPMEKQLTNQTTSLMLLRLKTWLVSPINSTTSRKINTPPMSESH